MAHILTVSSENDVRAALRDTERDQEVRFRVSESSSLEGARSITRFLTIDGGVGELLNPETLAGKHQARDVVLSRLRHLFKWRSNVQQKVDNLNHKLQALQAVVDGEVQAVPRPIIAAEDLPQFYLHVDAVPEDRVDAHIDELLAPFLDLQISDAAEEEEDSDHEDIDDDEYEALRQREVREKIATLKFNMDYLRVKRDALIALLERIDDGVETLNQTYLAQESQLGCSRGKSDIMEEVYVYHGERQILP